MSAMGMLGQPVAEEKACFEPTHFWFLGVRRECDSPEGVCFVVLLRKLDCVIRNSPQGGQLCDNSGGNHGTALISHDDARTHQQLTIYLHSCPMSIQVGGSGRRRKRTLLAILPR